MDFNKIDKLVEKAISADAKYYSENDAKFRAVHQKVATYEEFKDIVEASHLKPLDKTDKITQSGTFNQVWNCQAIKNTKSDNHTIPENTNINISTIKTSVKFWQTFKCIENLNEKLCFLKRFLAKDFQNFIKPDIPVDQLGNLIRVLSIWKDDDDFELKTEFVNIMKKSNRFKLNFIFLSSDEKEMLSKL